jgi:tyrosyl-tRNA synthetase
MALLDAPARGGSPLTVYAGFDPTAPSLHVGNLLQQCTLRRLQLGGHRPIALAGGGTGMIGDPGGKSEERNLLGPDDVERNLKGVQAQLERFLDFSTAAPETTRALLVNNAEWLCTIPLVDFLRDTGKHFTVNQMVAKESVKARFERPDKGISYTEFSYMLLQAYDFLTLFDRHGCTLQIGGSDQWGNITLGVELVRKVRRQEVYGLTSPLVLKADGTKFGKTEAGTVWLASELTSPYRLYQYFVNTEDAVVGAYLRYFTFLGHDQIEALDAETATNPGRRAAPRALAREVCALVHGHEEVDKAERAAAALWGV